MKKGIVSVLLLMCVWVAQGQERFSKLYDFEFSNNNALNVIPLSDGYLFASETGQISDEDTLNSSITYLFIVKVDLNGNVVWTKYYRKPHFSIRNFIITPCLDTNFFIIAGRINDIVQEEQTGQKDGDLFFAKIDRNGDTIWTGITKFNSLNENPLQMLSLPDSGYLIRGTFIDPYNTPYGVFLLKVDENGYKVWGKVYDSIASPYIHSLMPANDQGYIISGSNGKPLLIKVDSLGNEQWRRIHDVIIETGAGISKTQNDGYLVAGYLSVKHPTEQVYIERGGVVKIDSQGSVLWERIIDKEDLYCYFSYAIELQDGSIIGMGNRYSDEPNQGTVGWLVKFDSGGSILWERKYGTLYDSFYPIPYDVFYDLKPTKDNGFILSGHGNDYSNNGWQRADAWLVKVDSFGCLQPDCQLNDGIQWIHDQQKAALFPPYPNPANGIVNLNCYIPESLKNGQLFLYDLMGKQVAAYELHAGYSNFSFDTEEIPAGLYSVILHTHGQPLQSRKIVVVK